MRRAASLVLAAAALSFAAPASAADPSAEFAPGSPAAQAAQTIARDHWQAAPCAGEISLVWMPLGVTTNATSTWANAVGQYDAPERSTDCEIALNSALAWDWARFCSILVHEYGHLNGRAHAETTTDVMYAYYEAPIAACATTTTAVDPVAPVVLTAPVTAPEPAPAVAARHRAISASRAVRRGMLVRVRQHGHRHRKHRARHDRA